MKTLAFILIALLHMSQGKLYRTPKGVTYFIEDSYKYTWFDAFLECSFRGMALYSLQRQDQFDDLHQLLTSDKFSKKPPNVWIGAVGAEGKYVWIKDRKPLEPQLWGQGNPDNYKGTEHCVHIWNTKKYLNDCDCLDKFGFVCEIVGTDNDNHSGIGNGTGVEGKYKGLTINLIQRN